MPFLPVKLICITFFLIIMHYTEDKGYCLISTLDCIKASVSDNFLAKMLKATACSIVPSVTKFFNLSIRTGTFPQSWEYARVVPIPKKGFNTNQAYYRIICTLCILS